MPTDKKAPLPEAKALPERAGIREFARLAGFKASYVSQLKNEGRLVLDETSRQVLVRESLARIEETSDPSKAGVAKRHADARAEGATQTDGQGNGEGGPDSGRVGSSYHASRAVRERYLALSAKRDYDVSMGALLEAAEVKAAIRDAAITLRTRLEGTGRLLAAQLAPLEDEGSIAAVIDEHVEHSLAELSRHFATLATEEPA